MSSSVPIPPPFADRKPEAVEDCRDYLRTGRCKYGSSCKYNHPHNVQNGGGMRAPLDPTEPMFPIRPHEPVCQYYMKHATCKFGQACKFHHPPHAALHGIVGGHAGGGIVGGGGGGPVLMNVGRKIDAPQLILNPVGTDLSGSSMMMQLLPQRPNEPDCIYFLKNGRCKYGATCRYHHPVNYHQRRMEEPRRPNRAPPPPQQQDSYGVPFVQYVTHGPFPQGPVVVADGPLTFVSVDGAQSYKPVSLVPGNEGLPTYCPPVGSTVATEQGSTTSSIASSYDTASSSMDHLAAQGDTSSAALWNRAKKNRSGGSLNAHISGGGVARGTIPTVRSDGSIARRGRTGSYGSASDHGAAHFDATTGAATGAAMGTTTANARTSGNPTAAAVWRQDRPSSVDHTRRMSAGHYAEGSGGGGEGQSQQSHRGRPPSMRGTQQRRARQGQRSRTGDEGFTRMTSALLNMLDTPEETPADMYSDEGSYRYDFDESDSTAKMLEGLSMQDDHQQRNPPPPTPPGYPHDGDASQWSPTWQGSSSGMSSDQKPQAMHPGQHPPSPSSEHSDFGLYLP